MAAPSLGVSCGNVDNGHSTPIARDLARVQADIDVLSCTLLRTNEDQPGRGQNRAVQADAAPDDDKAGAAIADDERIGLAGWNRNVFSEAMQEVQSIIRPAQALHRLVSAPGIVAFEREQV